jgi:prepilin-type N-terminal cleavage/methylation domain-containing protein
MKTTNKSGVTLIELLVVLAIFLLVGALTTTYYSRFFNQNAVATTTDQLVQFIHKAQFYSQIGKESGGVWGVKYVASPQKKLTLFLNGNSAFDENYNLNSNITVSGLTQITFDHVTGIPNPIGPTTIAITANNETKSVSVNTQGIVSRN